MAPKTKFSKEQIVEAAFDIAKVEGVDSITIRKVADKLGSSIAPIYVNFQDVDELLEAVIKNIYSLSNQMIQEENSANKFSDIGIACLKFARKYSVLFRDLLLKNNRYLKGYDEEMGSALIREMKKDPELFDFNDEELGSILLKMRIFQLGISVMVANELLPEEFDENKAIEILNNTAADIILATRIRKKEPLKFNDKL